jgi:hypothetical protein
VRICDREQPIDAGRRRGVCRNEAEVCGGLMTGIWLEAGAKGRCLGEVGWRFAACAVASFFVSRRGRGLELIQA